MKVPVPVSIVARQDRREAELLLEAGLFSEDFYRHQLDGDTTATLEHFLNEGWRLGKNPSPNFDVSHYLRTYPDVAAAGDNPVVHYLMHGWKEGRSPHPEFDVDRYVHQHPTVDFRELDPLTHCISTYGSIVWSEDAPADTFNFAEIDPLFDSEYYRTTYEDVRASGVDPLSHYLTFGWRENRNPSAEFDTWHFLQQHPEFRDDNVSPLQRYVSAGMPTAWELRPAGSVTLEDGKGGPAFDPKLAVHAHLYFSEYIEPIFHALSRVRAPFVLFVSTCSRANEVFISNFLARHRPKFEWKVRLVENRGRDIGPMMTAFEDLWTEYDIIAHLHSKKSPHLEFGASWFEYALDQTFGSSELVDSVLKFLVENPDVGLFYPENYREIKPYISSSTNGGMVSAILARIGAPDMKLSAIPELCAGSMGWFRAETYRRLASTFSSSSDFDPEDGQIDQTLAHAIEHSFVAVARAQGFRAVCYYPRRRSHSKFRRQYTVGLPDIRMSGKWPRDNPRIAGQRPVALAPLSKVFDRRRLDIHWVVPNFIRGAGGHMNIFIFVEALERLGHRQTIWFQSCGDSPDRIRKSIRSWFRPISDDVVIRLLPDDTRQLSGDVVIATDCWTVFPVISTSNFKERFYFIQDFEPYFHPMGENYFIAEQTYKLGLCGLCAGDWLMERVGNYNMWARKWEFAYDKGIYFANRQNANSHDKGVKIAFYARGYTPRRGRLLGIAAFEEMRRRGYQFRVIMFGEAPTGETFDFPCEERGVLSLESLADLYNECDVGVVFSATNYSLVPLEMMACELPVVEMDAPSTRAVYRNGEVTFAAPDPNSVADAIHRMMTDAALRDKQIVSARNFIDRLDWRTSVREVETAIVDRLLDRGFVPIEPEKVCRPAVQNKPTASVVIPTYNAGPGFKKVMEQLKDQRTSFTYEILVIDSGSSDETLDVIRSCNVGLVEIPNQQFQHGRTRNLGIAESSGHYAAMITQDATPCDDSWLENLIAGFAISPRIAGVFGRHKAYPEHGPFATRDLDEMFLRFAEFGPLYSLETGLPSFIHRGTVEWQMIMQFYSSNNSAIARDVWKTLPYPEVDWGEDQVWCWEMLKAGFSKAYMHDAAVLHSHAFAPKRQHEVATQEGKMYGSFFGWSFCEDDAAKEAEISRLNTRDAEFAAATRVPFDLLKESQRRNRATVEGRMHGAMMSRTPPEP
jgi:glycosyltransferase involved in cell wall biosynthesis/GT2 family glycosyltransferase